MEVGVFSFIGTAITDATNAYLVGGVTSVITVITPMIALCVTIYVIVNGYLIYAGKIENPATDLFIKCGTILVFTGLALASTHFNTYVVGGVEALGEGLAGAMSNSNNTDNVYQLLDALMQTALEQSLYCFKQMGLNPATWSWFLTAIVTLVSTTSLTLASAIIIIGSKFLLTMLLLIGPLFVCLGIFPLTRKHFDSWLGKLFENVLVQVFSIAVISMSVAITNHFFSGNDITTNSRVNPIGVAFQVLILCGILTFIIKQIPNMAAVLAGVFSSASMTLRDVMKPAAMAFNGLPSGGRSKSEPRSERQTWDEQSANKISRSSARDQIVNEQLKQHARRTQKE